MRYVSDERAQALENAEKALVLLRLVEGLRANTHEGTPAIGRLDGAVAYLRGAVIDFVSGHGEPQPEKAA